MSHVHRWVIIWKTVAIYRTDCTGLQRERAADFLKIFPSSLQHTMEVDALNVAKVRRVAAETFFGGELIRQIALLRSEFCSSVFLKNVARKDFQDHG